MTRGDARARSRAGSRPYTQPSSLFTERVEQTPASGVSCAFVVRGGQTAAVRGGAREGRGSSLFFFAFFFFILPAKKVPTIEEPRQRALSVLRVLELLV